MTANNLQGFPGFNQTRPPLPLVGDYGVDINGEGRVSFGPEVKLSDWMTERRLQDLVKDVDNQLRGTHYADTIKLNVEPQDLPSPNFFTLGGGGPSNDNGIRAGLTLFTEQYNLPVRGGPPALCPESTHLTYGRRTAGRPSPSRIVVARLSLETLSESCKERLRGRGYHIRAWRSCNTMVKLLGPVWPYRALFRAGLIHCMVRLCHSFCGRGAGSCGGRSHGH